MATGDGGAPSRRGHGLCAQALAERETSGHPRRRSICGARARKPYQLAAAGPQRGPGPPLRPVWGQPRPWADLWHHPEGGAHRPNVLSGENTGKELVAWELHPSAQAGEVFLSVTWAQETLQRTSATEGGFNRRPRTGRAALRSPRRHPLPRRDRHLPPPCRPSCSAPSRTAPSPRWGQSPGPGGRAPICATNRPSTSWWAGSCSARTCSTASTPWKSTCPRASGGRTSPVGGPLPEVYARKDAKRSGSRPALRKLRVTAGREHPRTPARRGTRLTQRGGAPEPGDFCSPPRFCRPVLRWCWRVMRWRRWRRRRSAKRTNTRAMSARRPELGLTRTALYRRIAKYDL